MYQICLPYGEILLAIDEDDDETNDYDEIEQPNTADLPIRPKKVKLNRHYPYKALKFQQMSNR